MRTSICMQIYVCVYGYAQTYLQNEIGNRGVPNNPTTIIFIFLKTFLFFFIYSSV